MDSAALIAQLQGELGKSFTPESTLNAIGQPLWQSAKQELDLDQAQRQQALTNLLNSRGLVGSGIEQQNNQIFQQNMANRAQQALRDAVLHQNTLGLGEFQQGRTARVNSLLDLLRSSQQGDLARAQQTLQERLAQIDVNSRQALAAQALAAQQSLEQQRANLQAQTEQRQHAWQQFQAEQQAKALAAILGQQQSQAASAANAAGFTGAISGLDRPFDPFNELIRTKEGAWIKPTSPSTGWSSPSDPLGLGSPSGGVQPQWATATPPIDNWSNQPNDAADWGPPPLGHAYSTAQTGSFGPLQNFGSMITQLPTLDFMPPATYAGFAPPTVPLSQAVTQGMVAPPALANLTAQGYQTITSPVFTPAPPTALSGTYAHPASQSNNPWTAAYQKPFTAQPFMAAAPHFDTFGFNSYQSASGRPVKSPYYWG